MESRCGLSAGFAKVIQRAKQAGSLVVIWEDDQIKEVLPEELESRITAQSPRKQGPDLHSIRSNSLIHRKFIKSELVDHK